MATEDGTETASLLSPRFRSVRWWNPGMWGAEKKFWMLFSVVSGSTACESARRSYWVLIVFERAGVAPRSSIASSPRFFATSPPTLKREQAGESVG